MKGEIDKVGLGIVGNVALFCKSCCKGACIDCKTKSQFCSTVMNGLSNNMFSNSFVNNQHFQHSLQQKK